MRGQPLSPLFVAHVMCLHRLAVLACLSAARLANARAQGCCLGMCTRRAATRERVCCSCSYFIPSENWSGMRPHYSWEKGPMGLGYYKKGVTVRVPRKETRTPPRI